MKEESIRLSDKLMPRQPKEFKTKVTNGYEAKFYSNIYEIRLKNKSMPIYQYSLDISPQIAHDSDGQINKIMKTIHTELKKEIGTICHKGFMIWGRKNSEKVLTLKAEFNRNE
jgi:hypothetical protein